MSCAAAPAGIRAGRSAVVVAVVADAVAVFVCKIVADAIAVCVCVTVVIADTVAVLIRKTALATDSV